MTEPGGARDLPRIVFVLGKGGVGRSTVAAALASELAAKGARTLIFGWTIADPIGPWFGLAPAGLAPQAIGPRLSVANYRLEDTLKLYFVEHLRLPRFYRHVIGGEHIRRLIAAAPGLAEVFFVGHLWWLTTLAREEAGLDFDHVVVDAPATGHGASLFDLPEVLSSVGVSGLLRTEAERVTGMMADPAWTGAVVVTLPEELSAEETAELVPRLSRRMGRKPLHAFINRSVTGAGVRASGEAAPWRYDLFPGASTGALATLGTIAHELRRRSEYERALRALLAGAVERSVVDLRDQLACSELQTPRDVVRAIADEIDLARIGGAPR